MEWKNIEQFKIQVKHWPKIILTLNHINTVYWALFLGHWYFSECTQAQCQTIGLCNVSPASMELPEGVPLYWQALLWTANPLPALLDLSYWLYGGGAKRIYQLCINLTHPGSSVRLTGILLRVDGCIINRWHRHTIWKLKVMQDQAHGCTHCCRESPQCSLSILDLMNTILLKVWVSLCVWKSLWGDIEKLCRQS